LRDFGDVLEHLYDLEETLIAIRDLLKDDVDTPVTFTRSPSTH
jgi:hypothetical protein